MLFRHHPEMDRCRIESIIPFYDNPERHNIKEISSQWSVRQYAVIHFVWKRKWSDVQLFTDS